MVNTKHQLRIKTIKPPICLKQRLKTATLTTCAFTILPCNHSWCKKRAWYVRLECRVSEATDKPRASRVCTASTSQMSGTMYAYHAPNTKQRTVRVLRVLTSAFVHQDTYHLRRNLVHKYTQTSGHKTERIILVLNFRAATRGLAAWTIVYATTDTKRSKTTRARRVERGNLTATLDRNALPVTAPGTTNASAALVATAPHALACVPASRDIR